MQYKSNLSLLFSLVLLLNFGVLRSQTFADDLEVSLGYLGNGAIRPGAQIGLYLPLKQWETEKTKKDKVKTKTRTSYLYPQLGTYWRQNFYISILANASLGIHRQIKGRKMYTAYAIGLGYLATYEVESFSVDFSGDITDKQREQRSFFLPNLSYELGLRLGSRMRVYTTISYGVQLSGRFEPGSQMYLGLGLRRKLTKS